MRHVRHHNFFYENSFWLPCCRTTTCNKLNRCKTLVLVAYERNRKTLYFHKLVRNDDATPLKNREKQHANELWSILVLFSRFGLFKRINRKCIPSGLIYAKETSFSTKRKVVKDNYIHGIQATISTLKVIKIQFNFALWVIDWMPNQAHRQKNFAGRFRLPPQPNGAMQNYSILRLGYRSLRCLDTKCTVGILITYCHSICAEKNRSTLNCMLQENAPSWQSVEWMDKRTYVSLIHMAILTTIYWI